MRTDVWRRGENSHFEADLHLLVKAYHNFERPDVRRKFKDGRFQQFLVYLKNDFTKYLSDANHPIDQQQQDRLVQLARTWWWKCLSTELINAFVLTTIAVAVLLGLAAVAWLAFGCLSLLFGALGNSGNSSPMLPALQSLVAANYKNVSTVVVLLLSLLGITYFLREYMGDVQFWSTYEETDAKHKQREEIIKRGTKTLKHVLSDEKCKRVVVIAHSLGATIAYDSLLEIGKLNQMLVTDWNNSDQLEALPTSPLPLCKIDTLITMGSPVDKIHYFFESLKGPNHRYIRVVDQIRGDLGKIPFATQTKFEPEKPFSGHGEPIIRWLNFWDQGDIVSGSLETPASWWNSKLTIDNVHSASYLFPNPGKCHLGYFQNSAVIGELYNNVFNSHVDHAARRRTPVVGPGRLHRLTRLLQGVAILLLWIVVAHIIFALLQASLLTNIAIVAEIALVGILALSWSLDYFFGPLNPLS